MRYRSTWNFVIFLIAMMLMMISLPLWATNRDNVSADSYSDSSALSSASTGDVVGGDVSVTGDKNRAYALGMASGTIADCMAHWGIAIVNIPARNKFCERIDFTQWAENPARHTENSVKIRCSSKIATEIFGNREACETAFVTVEPEDQHTQELSYLMEQIQANHLQINALRTELEAFRDEKKKALARVARAEKVAQNAAKKPQTSQYGLTEQQMTELEAWNAKWGEK